MKQGQSRVNEFEIQGASDAHNASIPGATSWTRAAANRATSARLSAN